MRYAIFLFVFISLLMFPSGAQANVILPTIVLTVPIMVFSFVPIVLIEGFYFSRALRFRFYSSVVVSFLANLFSSIIGIPVSWVVYFVSGGMLQEFLPYAFDLSIDRFVYAASIPERIHSDPWAVAVAYLFYVICLFPVSWKLEHLIVVVMKRDVDEAQINVAVRNANAITYALLGIWPLMILWWEYQKSGY